MADEPPNKATPLRANLDLIQVPQAGKPVDPARFKPLLISEFPPPKAPRLVRGMIAHGDLILIYGAWSCGKSFFTVDLSLSIAHGREWQGRSTTSGAVIYVAGEGAGSIQRRVLAWSIDRGLIHKGDPPFGLIGRAPNLLRSDADPRALVDAARAFGERVGELPALMVVDTLHAAAAGSKEDAEDTSKVLDHCRLIQDELGGIALALIHHSGKDAGKGARGSGSLEAAADVSIEIVEEEDHRAVIARKTRDSKLPDLDPFDIRGTVIAYDDQDEPVTAGFLVPVAPQASTRDPALQDQVRSMKAAGQSVRQIATTLGLPKSTVSDWLRANRS